MVWLTRTIGRWHNMAYSATNFQKAIPNTVLNSSGSTINGAVPVKTSAGGMAVINISLPADVEAIIGLTFASVANGSSGAVISSGTIPNINSFGYSFAAGDGIWIDSTGEALTNVPPVTGSAGFTSGMFVMKIGTVQPNLNTPSQLDLMVSIENRGQL